MVSRRAAAVWLGGMLLVAPAIAAPPDSSPAAAAADPVPAPPSIVPPKLLDSTDVSYPEGAQGDARIVVTLVVGKDGKVREASADKALEPFATAALSAARSFRFEPATRDGVAIAAKIKIEIRFRAPEPPVAPLPEPEPAVATGDAKPPDESPTPRAADEKPRAKPPATLEVTVEGERAEPSRTATLSRAEVRQIPGTFGDPFRAIEALPGVTPIVSGLPFFFIRGAPPGNVGYFLDGVRVPLLFHVGIGPSVVHPGIVDRVDLYPGGYPARFGRFAGGIVAGETTPPVPRLRGEYNLRLFDAGAMVEAPFAEGRGTALVGGRYSYTAFLLSLLSPETELEYWDYQLRATYDVSSDDRLGVFSFGSFDFLGQRTQQETLTLFGTEFHRVDLRYDRRFSATGTMRTAFTLGIDRSTVQQDRAVVSRLAGARTELVHELDSSVTLRAGTDLMLETYDIELGSDALSPSAQRAAANFPSRTDVALGVRGDTVLRAGDAFEVTPGLRLDLYGSEGATAVGIDPRLSTRTRISERVHLLTAFGIAHQPPSFVVPVPGFQPGGLRGGLQRAVQESMGVELDLSDSTTFTATAFQNSFFNMSDPLGVNPPLPRGCAPGAYPADSLGGDFGATPKDPPLCGVPRFVPGTLGPDRSGGGGQGADSRGGRSFASALEVRTLGAAYGLELFLKRKLTKKLGGFVSYTLSRSTRSYGRRRYVASFDRTHVFNAAAAYDLGNRWRAGTRFVFYTGLPTTPDPNDPSDTRLPPFVRADLRLEKRWQLSKTVWISGVAEWMNATLSKEAVSTECTLAGCEAQEIGPITIPSVGVEGGF
ncbi:MAG: TonB family protein [Polyangiaceae bacterium]